jgi:RNA 2',3'-cyclic 3'-phosphodiesterase
VRCFIALPLPVPARAALAEASAKCRESLTSKAESVRGGPPRPRISWVKAEGYHLTLAFLGDIQGAAREAAASALDVAGGFGDIGFRFSGFGGFPSLGSWRLLFAKLEDEGGSARLSRAVNAALVEAARRSGLGLLNPERPSAKPFVPHVTLARAGSGRVKAGVPLAEAGTELAGAWTFGRCVLYKSELLRSGAVYTELRGVELS